MAPQPTADDGRPTALHQALATLPGLLDATRLTVVPGGEGWLDRARAAETDGAILVVDGPTPTDEPLALPGTVFLHRTWADAPELGEAATQAAPLVDETGLALSVVVEPVGTDVRRALTDHVDLVERVLGEAAEVRVIRQDRTGYDAIATLVSGCRVSMALICTDAKSPSAMIELVRPDRAFRYRLTDPTSAAPNEITLEGADGLRRLPPVWEPAARGCWRRVRAVVDGGERPDDVARFERQLYIVAAALD